MSRYCRGEVGPHTAARLTALRAFVTRNRGMVGLKIRACITIRLLSLLSLLGLLSLPAIGHGHETSRPGRPRRPSRRSLGHGNLSHEPAFETVEDIVQARAG